MENTTPPKFKDSKKGKALSADIEKQFLEAAKESYYYPLYRMASLTGMRIGKSWGCNGKTWILSMEKSILHIHFAMFLVRDNT